MSTVVPFPYTVDQDETGIWCAAAQLRPGVGAVGDGNTAEEAVDDLKNAVVALIEERGRRSS